MILREASKQPRYMPSVEKGIEIILMLFRQQQHPQREVTHIMREDIT